ncbi:hypothetical protein VMCG_00786 [Cytospora schulzeri]|uniref:Uncharacterized protein n=1 Tax=Cytospora schulzeri TaxID=448051 RepID=A0A423XA74_9PEZI|nr:hypothetical protein VMCG_00786 [Valsa malicola]
MPCATTARSPPSFRQPGGVIITSLHRIVLSDAPLHYGVHLSTTKSIPASSVPASTLRRFDTISASSPTSIPTKTL